MINPEEFAELAKSIQDGNDVPNEKAKEIVKTIYEMDASLVILQNTLELAVENAREIIPAVAQRVLAMSGRTGKKIEGKAARYSAEVTARFEIALQMYLSGAAEKAEEMLLGAIDGEGSLNDDPREEIKDEENQKDMD